MRGVAAPFAELLRQPMEPPPGSPLSRLISGESIVQIADMSELSNDPSGFPRAQAAAAQGFRTALFVPLRKDGALLGTISAHRREVRPFSEKQIALVPPGLAEVAGRPFKPGPQNRLNDLIRGEPLLHILTQGKFSH